MTHGHGTSCRLGAGFRVEIAMELMIAEAKEAQKETLDAYFVAPASHIGRVVTGVLFLSEHFIAKDQTSLSQATQALALQDVGLCTISFADKLAEQGYKVLVVPLLGRVRGKKSTECTLPSQLLAQAATYLRQECDVQRVALLGIGDAADFVMQISLEKRLEKDSLAECAIAMCPNGSVDWCSFSGGAKDTSDAKNVCDAARHMPLLVLNGEKHALSDSKALKKVVEHQQKEQQELDATESNADSSPTPLFRLRTFANQSKGFAFDDITDEDTATEAIAEVLDWLAVHLYRFRIAACTSDMDPWWPQGRNGPFLNVGYQRWQEIRSDWNTQRVPRAPRAAPVLSQLIFEELSSMRRTYDLPQQMALGDVVEILCEIWEVQQT